MDMFEKTIARNLVECAAGIAILCPSCGDILDAKETVVLTDTADNTVCMCVKCYARPVGSFTTGCVTVYDGRDLCAPKHKLFWRYAA